MDSTLPKPTSLCHLTEVVCWTRMQAESGQDVRAIVGRKELERRAGQGVFFWGIGNAPNRTVKNLATQGDKIDVVFSLMKSRPKSRDTEPTGVVVWQTYYDVNGIEHELPNHVLVTSRMETESGLKRVHYALMCSSQAELRIDDQGPFDPLAYRNLSEAKGRIGPSQVTALVVRTDAESSMSDYRINLRAELTGSYWVRLGQPSPLTDSELAALVEASANATSLEESEWILLVTSIRQRATLSPRSQSSLF